MVSAVVDQAKTELGDAAAMGLVLVDDACVHILLIKGVLALAGIFFQTERVGLNVVIGEASSPIEIGHPGQRSLHAADESEQPAVKQMVTAFEIRVAGVGKTKRIERTGCIAVETVKAVGFGIIIGEVEEKLGVFYQIRHVGIKAQDAGSLGVA